MAQAFQIGVAFPTTEIGTDASVIRDFGQAVEDLGFDYLLAYDHIVGADITNRPEWDYGAHPFTHESAFYEPIVLFSYLAAVTRTLRFMSGVVILPQRQTVLFAKQTATLDVLCGGRLSLGVGLGWNEIEYEAVGEGLAFSDRAPRMEEQIGFLRRLWCEPVVTAKDQYHTINAAGINPLPIQRPIPIIIGGMAKAAINRAARMGDGWFPFLSSENAETMIRDFKTAVVAAGRNPDEVIVHNNVLLGATMGGGKVKTVDEAASEAGMLRKAGAHGLSYSTMDRGFKTAGEHIAFLRELSNALNRKRPG